MMRFKQFLATLVQSFAFGKLLPGVLIGLFAYQFADPQGQDAISFVFYMVVFWAAIGVGHGLAQLATSRLNP
jgi:hypothetical protein